MPHKKKKKRLVVILFTVFMEDTDDAVTRSIEMDCSWSVVSTMGYG